MWISELGLMQNKQATEKVFQVENGMGEELRGTVGT